jgi:hypothetical protein
MERPSYCRVDMVGVEGVGEVELVKGQWIDKRVMNVV